MAGVPTSSWRNPLNICIVQPLLELGDLDHNLQRAVSLIDEAAGRGSIDLFVLPEVFATGFPYDELPSLAQRSKEVISQLSGKARELDAAMMFTQVVEDNGKFFNRFFAIGPDGSIMATYDKTHLFTRAGEDKFFTPGNGTTELEFRGARMAPLICYEVRFPEMARKHVLNGVDILLYPAMWPAFRVFQWEILLKARAIENQCYVVGIGGFGPHGDTQMGGHSMVIAPYGDVLCRIDDNEGYASCTIGPERIQDLRKRIPVLQERRPDIY